MCNNNGGQAFPAYEYVAKHSQMMAVGGMTLRDYFAAKAMQGLLADSKIEATHAEFAAGSYKMADAMLKARECGK